MEQALSDVKQSAVDDAELARLFEQRLEVPISRLVGANVLCRQDLVEWDIQPPAARRERLPIDVGEDDQLEVFGQGDKSVVRVGKRRPIRDRCGQPPGLLG